MPMTVPSHITVDDDGVARIDRTRLKVIHVVEAWKAGASTPKKLRQSFPHLSMAQVHAALAYYYDHETEIEAEIERGVAAFKAAQSGCVETPARKKLRDLGLRR